MPNRPKTKLELTWPGKENRPRLEPRILLEDKALSYAAVSSQHGVVLKAVVGVVFVLEGI